MCYMGLNLKKLNQKSKDLMSSVLAHFAALKAEKIPSAAGVGIGLHASSRVQPDQTRESGKK